MHPNPLLLNDDSTGSYAVRTASGTFYAIDLDPPLREIMRLTKERTPSSPYDQLPAADLRRDGETVKLLKIIEIQVGRCGHMVLDVRRDGVPTLRTTTEVLLITRPYPETRRS